MHLCVKHNHPQVHERYDRSGNLEGIAAAAASGHPEEHLADRKGHRRVRRLLHRLPMRRNFAQLHRRLSTVIDLEHIDPRVPQHLRNLIEILLFDRLEFRIQFVKEITRIACHPHRKVMELQTGMPLSQPLLVIVREKGIEDVDDAGALLQQRLLKRHISDVPVKRIDLTLALSLEERLHAAHPVTSRTVAYSVKGGAGDHGSKEMPNELKVLVRFERRGHAMLDVFGEGQFEFLLPCGVAFNEGAAHLWPFVRIRVEASGHQVWRRVAQVAFECVVEKKGIVQRGGVQAIVYSAEDGVEWPEAEEKRKTVSGESCNRRHVRKR